MLTAILIVMSVLLITPKWIKVKLKKKKKDCSGIETKLSYALWANSQFAKRYPRKE